MECYLNQWSRISCTEDGNSDWFFPPKRNLLQFGYLHASKITCLGDMPRPPYKRKSTRCCKNLTREYKKESFSGLIQFDVHSCEIPQLIRYKDKRVQWKLYYFGSSTVDPFSEHRFVIVGKLVGLELEIRLLSHPQEAIFAVNEPTNIKMSNLIRTRNVKQQKVLHLWQL